MAEISILFWNTGRRSCGGALARIVADRQPDLIVLAELATPVTEIVAQLNSEPRGYHIPLNRSKRLHFLMGKRVAKFESLFDGVGIAVRRVRPVIGADFLLVAAHFPSKLRLTDADQAQLCTRLAKIIQENEAKSGHERTIIVGDLNMNPFEHGVVGSEGLHAVMARSVASQRTRTVQGTSRRMFYNPMWSLMGDNSDGPPGSYFYRSSAPTSYFWNMFDQFILSAELARSFQRGDVAVLESAAGESLLSPRGTPNVTYSDHLPLFAVVRVEDFADGNEEPVGRSVGRAGGEATDVIA